MHFYHNSLNNCKQLMLYHDIYHHEDTRPIRSYSKIPDRRRTKKIRQRNVAFVLETEQRGHSKEEFSLLSP